MLKKHVVHRKRNSYALLKTGLLQYMADAGKPFFDLFFRCVGKINAEGIEPAFVGGKKE